MSSGGVESVGWWPSGLHPRLGALLRWRPGPEFFRDRAAKVLLGAVAVGVAVKVYSRYKRQQRRRKWNKAGKDVVVLHQFQRGTSVPNLSPYALKLETYLRMAGVRYIVDTEEPTGPQRGKCPWITINGQELSDSELVIDFLSRHFGQPLSAPLSAEQQAIGRAVQVMLDEHTAPLVFYKRYCLDRMDNMINWLPREYRFMLRVYRLLFMRKFREYFWTLGVGRFSGEEAMMLLRREVRALAGILGDKPFLLGADPSSYDAAVFAELTQVLYGCAPEVQAYVEQNHPSLVRHHNRMKDKYWPDWDQCRAK